MVNWLKSLSEENQIMVIIAIIGGSVSIIVAIINGIFGIIRPKEKYKTKQYSINQTAHDNSTQIGVQINRLKDEE